MSVVFSTTAVLLHRRKSPLRAKALNRLRDSQRPHRLSGNIIPRGEMVSSGPAALS
jgi:hypothetical protein